MPLAKFLAPWDTCQRNRGSLGGSLASSSWLKGGSLRPRRNRVLGWPLLHVRQGSFGNHFVVFWLETSKHLKSFLESSNCLEAFPSIPNRPQKTRTIHGRTVPSTSTVPCARAQAPFTSLQREGREEPRIPYRHPSPRTLDVPFHRTIRAKHTCLTHNRGNSQGNPAPSFLWPAADGSTYSCAAGSLGPTCILKD